MIDKDIMKRIKLVAFDFDNTLCVHSVRHTNRKIEQIQGLYEYNYSKPNRHMKEFIQLCKDNFVTMGLISSTDYHLVGLTKLKWCKKNYGVDLKNWNVGTPDLKLEMMENLATALHINPANMMIVDDNFEVLQACEKAGFITCIPLEIVNYMEEID